MRLLRADGKPNIYYDSTHVSITHFTVWLKVRKDSLFTVKYGSITMWLKERKVSLFPKEMLHWANARTHELIGCAVHSWQKHSSHGL
jgi:hypothetical protein